MVREGVLSGLRRTGAEGKRLGRLRATVSIECRIERLRRSGKGIQAIAKGVGFGVSVVQGIVKAMA